MLDMYCNYFQWHSLSREEQAKYYEKARIERQRHMQLYPHWNARDNYRYGAKKKKRKRDKSDDPGSALAARQQTIQSSAVFVFVCPLCCYSSHSNVVYILVAHSE